jgi:hypothetical protein
MIRRGTHSVRRWRRARRTAVHGKTLKGHPAAFTAFGLSHKTTRNQARPQEEACDSWLTLPIPATNKLMSSAAVFLSYHGHESVTPSRDGADPHAMARPRRNSGDCSSAHVSQPISTRGWPIAHATPFAVGSAAKPLEEAEKAHHLTARACLRGSASPAHRHGSRTVPCRDDHSGSSSRTAPSGQCYIARSAIEN